MAKRSRKDFESVSESEKLAAPSKSFPNFTPETAASASKILQYDPESGEPSAGIEMKCSLPPHPETLTFSTYEEFEIHYSKTHTHRCLECRRNFPTEHFLNLHIEENHDSLIAVRKERGEKTYRCFVEDCERKFSTKDKRRLHLIDFHFFPKEYDFAVVNHGVDNRSSMLRQRHRRRSSAAHQQEDKDAKSKKHSSTLDTIGGEGTADNGQAEDETTEDAHDSSPTPPDMDMEGLSSAMSSLKFVPRGVRFGRGRGRGRGGFSRT